jgi:hypothetical protein
LQLAKIIRPIPLADIVPIIVPLQLSVDNIVGKTYAEAAKSPPKPKANPTAPLKKESIVEKKVNNIYVCVSFILFFRRKFLSSSNVFGGQSVALSVRR